MTEFLYSTFLETGNAILSTWLAVVVVATLVIALSRAFVHVRKIQGRRSQWMILRHELFWSALNIGITTLVLKHTSEFLVTKGYLVTDPSPTAWYVVAYEFLLYFFVFDLYFYIVHRTLHVEPLYKWIHAIHHRSTTPNPLSSSSMNPIEGSLEGLVIPLFLTAFTVHETSMLLILPFATVMGLYVHSGVEVAPGWWYRSWATKWLQSPMFHDQHHQYFKCNYGAFTTIWDRVFGTVRKRFDQDFDRLTAQRAEQPQPAKAA